MTDSWLPRIASFVVQALNLEVNPSELISEIVALKRDESTGISALELQSSIGPTPFLIYHYEIAQSGRALLDADLATLENAAKLDTPGPRIVAHAIAGDDAYILATTPGIQRSMTGTRPVPIKRAPLALERGRTKVPDRLVDRLREANRLAGDWLAAIEASSATGNDDDLSFTEQEAALALFLLDENSIQDLLRALNILISTARNQTAPSVD